MRQWISFHSSIGDTARQPALHLMYSLIIYAFSFFPTETYATNASTRSSHKSIDGTYTVSVLESFFFSSCGQRRRQGPARMTPAQLHHTHSNATVYREVTLHHTHSHRLQQMSQVGRGYTHLGHAVL
jgi:hypothetical protein